MRAGTKRAVADADLMRLLHTAERLSLAPRRTLEEGRPPLAVLRRIADAQASLDALRAAVVARAVERLLDAPCPTDVDELMRILARAGRW